MLIRLATLPRGDNGVLGIAIKYGPRFGIFMALIGALMQLAGAVMAFRASAERLAWGRSA